MKKTIKYIMMAAVALTAPVFGSCDEDLAETPIILPDGGVGTGKWDNPMTVYQCRIGSINPEKNPAWVKGYIVGVINVNITNVLSERTAQFDGPFEVNTNLIIAMSPDERNWENCATVQLPSGAVRNALNLVDNPDNLGKLVTIKGQTGEKYCSAYGLRSCEDYNWGDIGKEEVELAPVDGPFYQDFEASTSFDTYKAQGWSNVAVKGGLSGWYVRKFDNTNYITVSAYNGTATGGPYENWLITPAIDMSKITEKTLEFVTQAAYTADNSILEVYVMTDNNPKTSTNTRLEAAIATPPQSGGPYSSWVESGKIDLSAYTGTIYIGWRYYSEHGGQSGSTTYCVDNINVGNATPNDPGTPDTPDTPAGDAIYQGLAEGAASIDWTFDNVLLGTGMTYIWKWTDYNGSHYLNGSGYSNGTALATKGYAYSPAFSLAGVAGATIEFDHAAKFQTTCTQLCKVVVREKGGEWKEFNIPTWPEAGSWKFANSGKIDISEFAGKEVEIGFKYESTAQGADTWEIKNVKVSKK